MMERVSESPSASSVVLPQLRSSRHDSVTSLSSASHLDKEARAQTLDQIHSSACNTDTLTTFSEFTSPPSASSAVDGKGIASELQGGLSGLYNRLRASVGNVRDIVSHITEDGYPHDRPLRDSQLHISSLTHSNSQSVDSIQLSTPSTDSLYKSQDSAAGRPSLGENVGLDHEKNEKDQQNRSKRVLAVTAGASLQASSSNSSVTSGPSVPLTQAVTRAAALPAVAEVNVSAVKERDLGGGHVSNKQVTKSTAQSKPPLAFPSEFYLGASVDKPNSETPGGGLTSDDPGPTQKAQGSRSILDTTPGATARFSDQAANNRPKNARKNDFATDDHILSGSVLESIGEPIRSPTKPSAGRNQDAVEASRTVTNPTTPRGDALTGTQAGDFTGDIAAGQSQKWNNQRPELTGKRPSVSSQSRLTRSPSSHQSQTSREGVTTVSPNTTRQSLPSTDIAENLDGYQVTSQLKTQATSIQNKDARSSKVSSQIKSKILNKEYWMRDENARDCFYCGDSFSTFRRKHHCSRYTIEMSKFYHTYALTQGLVAKYLMQNAHHFSRVHNLDNRGLFEFANPARVSSMDTMIHLTSRMIATYLSPASGRDMVQQVQAISWQARQGLSRPKQKIPIRVREFQTSVSQQWQSLQHVVPGGKQARHLFSRLMLSGVYCGPPRPGH